VPNPFTVRTLGCSIDPALYPSCLLIARHPFNVLTCMKAALSLALVVDSKMRARKLDFFFFFFFFFFSLGSCGEFQERGPAVGGLSALHAG